MNEEDLLQKLEAAGDMEGGLLKKLLASKLATKEWNDQTEIKNRSADLKKRFSVYKEQHSFKPGDLVRWKPGLRNKKWPADGEPAVVVEVLDQPIHDETKDAGSPYFREPLNIVLAIVDFDGDFNLWHFDQHRFEPLPT